MARLTLCMIVRDEEGMLAPCLASVRDAVDEMIVVDTGSRDASKRVASEAGARVFDFVWCDDFAAARNEALRHAHGDWVLVLDADERLGPGAGVRLREALRQNFDCGMLRLHDAATADANPVDVVAGPARQGEVQLVPRLLRRAGGLKYVDAIHESVMPWLRRRGMKVFGVDADIVHYGATKELVSARGKLDRNTRLLRVRIAKRPDDLAAWGYLAHDLMRAGEMAEAQAVVDAGWTHVAAIIDPRSAPSIHRLATARGLLALRADRFAQARETVRIARAIEGDTPDFAFLEAYAFESEACAKADGQERRALLESARQGYVQCLRFADRVFAQSFVVGASTWYGSTRLGTVELMLGQPAAALRAFDAALATRPSEREALLGRAEAMIALGDPRGALQRIEPLLDAAPDGWLLAASAVHALGLATDTRLFASRARSLSANGFLAPHRRERLVGLATA